MDFNESHDGQIYIIKVTVYIYDADTGVTSATASRRYKRYRRHSCDVKYFYFLLFFSLSMRGRAAI